MSSIYTRQDGTRGAIRKRKEPQPWDPAPLNQIPVKSGLAKPAHPAQPTQAAKQLKPATKLVEPNNKLLAGYLAHEFLTKGTLLGKRLEPSRADHGKADVDPVQAGPSKPVEFYKEVSYLLKADGVHIAGVVNPTQLGSWLQK
ncbi:embryo sac development arrest 6 [Rhynchospora pubera]|uniref:Embryo sac development arrest 6 n=1 Tax=Rhynchospora pubera TaxID=906938 RepID=A0AAV8CZV1_9POAL|nr:embryo sac development arrest 6 [Rhynchospora pubera]